MDLAIQGMNSVVATVSGYHGSERFNLIKLISQSGASYVGAMSRSTTHLICWRYEGKKCKLAKKFKIMIVNHRWIEDCIKQAKRLHENPYMLHSGEEVGPLSMEVPMINSFQKSNFGDESEKQAIPGWTDSFLLNEVGKTNSKLKRLRKTPKQGNWSSGRHHFEDPPITGLARVEHGDSSSNSSMHSAKEERKISAKEQSSVFWDEHFLRGKRKAAVDIAGTSSSEPSHKMKRLVKRDVASNNFGTLVLDLDLDNDPIRFGNKGNTTAVSECLDNIRNTNRFDIGESLHAFINNDAVLSIECFDDIEEIGDWNHLPTSRDSTSCSKDALTSLGKPDKCFALETLDGKVKDASLLDSFTNLTNSEVSCVICWTEYSSTRGVLPCGHRFCYSCIQTWADRMASERKEATCPLCKASFMSITKVEDAGNSDQKIYSQTIPCVSSASDIFFLMDQEHRFGSESSSASVCSECRCREPEDLLERCHLCQIRCIHSYCLDPPLLPWTCIHCKDLQVLYHQNC